MKYITLCLVLFFSINKGFSQGLDSLIVERYYISNIDDSINSVGNLPVGSTTYRIFVDLAPGYKFQAAYGNSNHELRFATTTSFFNNEDRGATTPTYTKAQARYNTVMLDSWLSVGAACAGNYGILKSQDNGISTVVNLDGILQNNNPLAGIPLTTQDGLIAGTPQTVTAVGIDNEMQVFDATSGFGNLFTTHNGAWSALNGAKGPTSENRVLIAQLTTNGAFSFELNIQIKDTVSNLTEQYVAINPTGNEIQNSGLLYSSNIAPTVSISYPTPTTNLIGGNSVNITADASDVDGTVTKVEFYVNAAKIGEDLTSPYEFSWICVSGIDTLKTVATDNNGAQTTSSFVVVNVGTVSVNNLVSLTQNVRIFPNPAASKLSLEIVPSSENRATAYDLYSISGAVLFHKDLGVISTKVIDVIDISKYSSGTYFIGINIDGKTIIKQFSKK